MVNWKTPNAGTYPPGSSVDVVRFAWTPTKCHDGMTYWLVRLKYTYKRSNDILFGRKNARHPSKYSYIWLDDYWELESVEALH